MGDAGGRGELESLYRLGRSRILPHLSRFITLEHYYLRTIATWAMNKSNWIAQYSLSNFQQSRFDDPERHWLQGLDSPIR